MPPNTISVARPGRWGNPFRVGQIGVPDAATAVALFRRALLTEGGGWQDMRFDLHLLRGINLACFCPLGTPCHRDVLLELANTFRLNEGDQRYWDPYRKEYEI
jgi:hypothetical protein